MVEALRNVSISASIWLHPPAYGFEPEFHAPPVPVDAPGPGAHQQLTLRVEGSVATSFAAYYLRSDLFVRGALWRSQTHHLCTALDEDPMQEKRSCSQGTGGFAASIWAFVPASRPGGEPKRAAHQAVGGSVPTPLFSEFMGSMQSLAPGATSADQLAHTADLLGRINVCTLSPPLPDHFVGRLCNASRLAASAVSTSSPGAPIVSPIELMQSREWDRAAHSDLYRVDWRSIGAAFILAALTLPQPFTIVESGNFCGGTTGYLALLKRLFCPACPFLSLDPGYYRKKRHARLSCNVQSLEFAGLRGEVLFVDAPSPVVDVALPVGFVYYDGGKVRFCNSPLQSYLEDRTMVGSLIGLDDVWQPWAMHLAKGHAGQIMMVDELVQTGDWEPLMVPKLATPNVATADRRPHAHAHRAGDGAPRRADLNSEIANDLFSHAPAAASELRKTRGAFPENIKQAVLRKVRSRFMQPREAEGHDADAIRVALLERGGREVASRWIRLPPPT